MHTLVTSIALTKKHVYTGNIYFVYMLFVNTPYTSQTDFANRDAKAAFFSRMEGGEPVGPPRSFHGPGTCIALILWCCIMMYMYMYTTRTCILHVHILHYSYLQDILYLLKCFFVQECMVQEGWVQGHVV